MSGMREREAGNEAITQEPALDSRWYPRLVQFGSFEAFAYLEGEKGYRAEQKNLFLAGLSDNPVLDYPKLNTEVLNIKEQGLLSLKQDVLAQEGHETVKQLYRWKINEKLGEVRMLKAAEKGDMYAFKRYGIFVYGTPSEEVFGYGVSKIRDEITPLRKSDKHKEEELAERLSTVFRKRYAGELAHPEKEEIKKLKKQTEREFDPILQGATEILYNSAEAAQHFRNVLELIGANDWKVEIDENNAGKTSGVNVKQEDKLIRVPVDRILTQQKLIALSVHEIGTHVLRRLNGENSKLKLLGIGLDRYEKGEEGVAKAREQALDGEVVQYSFPERQLAIALASGLDGTKRDFRETFAVMTDYFLLMDRNHEGLGKNGQAKAKDQAYDLCVRVFRGTDCKTEGVCFLKDKAYTEGNVEIWKTLKKDPKIAKDFSKGKYDPSRHTIFLDQLGI